MSEEQKVIEIRNRKYYSQYYVNQLQQENKQLKEIINKAKEKSIYLQNTYGYILDDLTFLLMIGSDKK